MPRLVNVAAGLLALGAACALYGLKYDTRRIEARVHSQERAVERTERDIAALKAERGYLGRPERIEHLARLQGLEPVRERQYSRIGDALDDGIAKFLDQRADDQQTEVDEVQAKTGTEVRSQDGLKQQP